MEKFKSLEKSGINDIYKKALSEKHYAEKSHFNTEQVN